MSTPLHSPPGRVRSRWVKQLQLTSDQNQDLVWKQVADALVQEKDQGFREENLAVSVFRLSLELEAPGCLQCHQVPALVQEEVDLVQENQDQEEAQDQDQDWDQDQGEAQEEALDQDQAQDQ